MSRQEAMPASRHQSSVEVPMLAPGALPAPLARRFLAFVLDVVAWVLCGGAFVAVGVVQAVGRGDAGEGLAPLTLVGSAMLLVLGLGQWWALGRAGWTLGRRLVGVRCVRLEDGGVPGLGRALLRQVVVGVAWSVPVLGPALLHTSPLTDVRRRGWQDRAAGLLQVDVVTGVDPTTAAVASRRLDDVLRTSVPAPAAAAPVSPEEGAASAPPAAGAPVATPPPPATVTAVPWAVRDDAEPAPAELLEPPTPLAPTKPDLPGDGGTVPAPVVTGLPSGVVQRSAALLDLEDTASGPTRARGRHAAGGDATGADGGRPRHDVPAPGRPLDDGAPAPGSVPGDVTDTAGRPVTRIVPPAPVHTSTSFASTSQQEDVEATRLRPARGKVPAVTEGRHEVTVALTDGQRVTITGTALVGRNPAPRSGESADHLIRVADPGRSVSKTHLQLGVDRGGLWIKDRDSTNGTVVTLADGQQILCGAEQQVRLPAGATVAFGDYGLSVVDPDG